MNQSGNGAATGPQLSTDNAVVILVFRNLPSDLSTEPGSEARLTSEFGGEHTLLFTKKVPADKFNPLRGRIATGPHANRTFKGLCGAMLVITLDKQN